MDQYGLLFSNYNLDLNDDEVKARVEKIIRENSEMNNKPETIMSLFGLLDFTSLNTTDNDAKVEELAVAASAFAERFPILPQVASICVYPSLVNKLRGILAPNIKITSVAGGFPSSQTYKEVKEAEVALAVADGADEVDVVMRVGDFLLEKYDVVSKEIAALKEAAGRNTVLKVILEVGELGSAQNIKKAALLAMSSGADFIKTSTGKVEKNASYEAALVMCEAIKEYCEQTKNVVGFKVAGGVSTTEQAINYYTIVQQVLGKDWLNKRLFRIGASKLFTNLLLSLSSYKK